MIQSTNWSRAAMHLSVVALGLVAQSGTSWTETKSRAQEKIDNPYCEIATYVRRDVAGQARAFIRPDGTPIIYIGAGLKPDSPYLRFLLAHECCHHTRGHLKHLQAKRRKGATLLFTMSNKQTELDADCCAAVTLSRMGDLAAISAAQQTMAGYGGSPTGPSYPSGLTRVSIELRAIPVTPSFALGHHRRRGVRRRWCCLRPRGAR